MVYEVDGEKYKQTIPDNGYEKGQIIDIMYEPEDPNDFYVYDKQAEEAAAQAEANGETEQESAEKNKLGLEARAYFARQCLDYTPKSDLEKAK